MNTAFTIGSDPELIILGKDGDILSAIGIIPGDKKNPTRIPDGQMIHDNVNVEFGIDPAASIEEWVDRTRSVMRHIARKVLPNGHRLAVRASCLFPDKELLDPEALLFGCDGDFDAYAMAMNVPPNVEDAANLRSCGGHVHIGHEKVKATIENVASATKAMDMFLGLPSLLLDKDESSARRRNLYGKAGCHRPKPYGVEYRSLGNFWIAHPELTRLVYLLTRDGLAAWENGHLAGINEGLVRKTINTGNKDRAEKALKGFILPLLQKDTRKLLTACLDMPLTSDEGFYQAWGL
jgi:hypothetical protein